MFLVVPGRIPCQPRWWSELLLLYFPVGRRTPYNASQKVGWAAVWIWPIAWKNKQQRHNDYMGLQPCISMDAHTEVFMLSHLKWLVLLPPTPGDVSFWTRIRITFRKMMKFTYIEEKRYIVYLIFWSSTPLAAINKHLVELHVWWASHLTSQSIVVMTY